MTDLLKPLSVFHLFWLLRMAPVPIIVLFVFLCKLTPFIGSFKRHLSVPDYVWIWLWTLLSEGFQVTLSVLCADPGPSHGPFLLQLLGGDLTPTSLCRCWGGGQWPWRVVDGLKNEGIFRGPVFHSRSFNYLTSKQAAHLTAGLWEETPVSGHTGSEVTALITRLLKLPDFEGILY